MNETIRRAYLCVGGPYDGRRHDPVPVGSFKVAVRQMDEPIPQAARRAPAPLDGKVAEPRDVWYHQFALPIYGETVLLWVPVDIGGEEVISRLLAGYRPDGV